MSHLYYLMGKSSSGKDTIYARLMENSKLNLLRIVPYTTRPIRDGEREGVEYHYTDVDELERLDAAGKVIERRAYNTVHGIWHYYTVNDASIDIAVNDYLMIGTLESYIKTREYFGKQLVLPIYIEVDDGERLGRALERERRQQAPKYAELCRRFLADAEDFSEERIIAAGITTRFVNNNLDVCYNNICNYIFDNKNK